MKGRDLIISFGEIDEKYLEEMLVRKESRHAKQSEQKQKGRIIMLRVGIAAAAVTVLAAAAGTGLIRFGSEPVRLGVIPDGEEVTTEGETASEESKTQADNTGETQETSEKEEFCIITAKGSGIEITEPDGTMLFAAEGRLADAKAIYTQNYLIINEVYAWQQEHTYGAGSGSHYVLDDVMLWPKNKPLAVVAPDDAFSVDKVSGEVSFLDIASGEWLMEPRHVDVFNLLGNDLWTDSEALLSYGYLYRTDGSRVTVERPDADEPRLYRQYINCLGDDRGTYYDYDGNVILDTYAGTLNHELLDILDDGYVSLARDLNDQTIAYGYDHNLIFREVSGLAYNGHCGEYFNWIAGGQVGAIIPGTDSLVTDRNLNIVLTESEFLEKNPQYAQNMEQAVGVGDLIRRDFVNISVCAVTDDYIEIRMEDMGSHRWIFCDRDFRELFPTKEVTLNQDETVVEYQKYGLTLRCSFSPGNFPNLYNGISQIPMRYAWEKETEDYEKILAETPEQVEEFRIGSVSYRLTEKYFWSEENGLCVFLTENGKERVYGILDQVARNWKTEIVR